MPDARPLASIVIPTFRRPERLAAALQSALAQTAEADFPFEIVVIDNDPAASARRLIDAQTRIAGAPLIYVHEPNPGVANARNAGLRAARGDLIAFLDDDEIATPRWLAELIRVQRESDADVVFGPVRTALPFDPPAHRAYFEKFFARTPSHPEGLIETAYGCGCSLLRRACLPSPEPFSPARNAIGGEDDLLFQQLAARGARFAWAPGAVVHEVPIPERVRLSYTLRRAFAFGQGPTSRAAASTPRDYRGAAFWMAVGAAQFCVYAPAAAAAWLVRLPGRARLLDRAARGLGKVFWWGPFKITFYDQAGAACATV